MDGVINHTDNSGGFPVVLWNRGRPVRRVGLLRPLVTRRPRPVKADRHMKVSLDGNHSDFFRICQAKNKCAQCIYIYIHVSYTSTWWHIYGIYVHLICVVRCLTDHSNMRIFQQVDLWGTRIHWIFPGSIPREWSKASLIKQSSRMPFKLIRSHVSEVHHSGATVLDRARSQCQKLGTDLTTKTTAKIWVCGWHFQDALINSKSRTVIYLIIYIYIC